MYKVWLFNRRVPEVVPRKNGRLILQVQRVCAEVAEVRLAETD